MGAFAEFERSLIRERQREGVALGRRGPTSAVVSGSPGSPPTNGGEPWPPTPPDDHGS